MWLLETLGLNRSKHEEAGPASSLISERREVPNYLKNGIDIWVYDGIYDIYTISSRYIS